MRLKGEFLVEILSNVLVLHQHAPFSLQFSNNSIAFDFISNELQSFVPIDFVDAVSEEELQVFLLLQQVSSSNGLIPGSEKEIYLRENVFYLGFPI